MSCICGSVPASIFVVWSVRNLFRFFAISWLPVAANMAAAKSAALVAPALPMANVAVGIPAGIWTMDRRESIPFRVLDFTGTARTGSGVMAAAIPGRCAAPPAPAMMHWIPLSAAVSA